MKSYDFVNCLAFGIIVMFVIAICGLIAYALIDESDKCNAPIQDTLVSVVDETETYISTAGIDRQDELVEHIGSYNGEILSISYPADGYYGYSYTVTIVWTKNVDRC